MLLRRHLILFLLPFAILSSNTTTCPYDIPYATNMISPVCYANSTTYPSATSCCWFFFAAYIYAAIRPLQSHRIRLPPPSHRLRPLLRLLLLTPPPPRPPLPPLRLLLQSRRRPRPSRRWQLPLPIPHRFPRSILRRFPLCRPSLLVRRAQPGLALVPLLPTPFGRRATLPSLGSAPSLFACSILQNIGNLGTGDILSSPPPPSLPRLITTSAVSGARKTTKVVAGSTAASSVIAIVVFLLLFFQKR